MSSWNPYILSLFYLHCPGFLSIHPLLSIAAMLLKLLQDLNVNKSPGPDGLHPTDMLKELSEALVKPLTIIYHLVHWWIHCWKNLLVLLHFLCLLMFCSPPRFLSCISVRIFQILFFSEFAYCQEYIKMRNQVKELVRKAKANMEKEIAKNAKKIWKNAGNTQIQRKTKSGISELKYKKENGEENKTSTDVVKLFFSFVYYVHEYFQLLTCAFSVMLS
jgi:hypothetical protein